MYCKIGSFSTSKKLQDLASFQESPFSLSLSARRFYTKRMSINLSIDWLPEKINSPIDDKEARGSTRLEEKQHHRTELTNGSNFFYRMLSSIYSSILRESIFSLFRVQIQRWYLYKQYLCLYLSKIKIYPWTNSLVP